MSPDKNPAGTTATVDAKDANQTSIEKSKSAVSTSASYESLKKSEKKQTLWQCRTLSAFLLFVVVNIVISFIVPHPAKVVDEAFIQSSGSEARQQGKWTWWISRNYLGRKSAPDIAMLGSSQMGSATFAADAHTLNQPLDCVLHRSGSTLEKEIFDRTGKRVDTFNFAMGGAMASDAYMFSKALFKGDKKPKMVVIGVSPRDFIDNTLPSVSSTEPFTFFAPFVELGDLTNVAFPDVLAEANFIVKQNLPLERIHEALDAAAKKYQQDAPTQMTAIPKASEHKSLLRAVLGSADEVRLNEWLIPASIPAWIFEDNTKEYLNRFRNCRPPLYKAEKAFFNAFLANMQAQHIPVLVVGMPSLAANRTILPNDFWTEFRGDVAGMCKSHNARWVDHTDNPSFVLENYLDTVHLNASGGTKIFAEMAKAIVADPELLSVVNAKPNQDTKLAKKITETNY
ncbi:MAG: hypothetical protein HYX67_11880 [Candidatus Melainabacteria bacterium]|nr:hypothetical protein [Candidatus Melainabacteria bacterium]